MNELELPTSVSFNFLNSLPFVESIEEDKPVTIQSGKA